MTASTVKICSRKKGKANRPSGLEEILLGYHIRLGPGSQESCVYLGIERLRRGKPMNQNFGIKPFYPKIGGHVFTPKFGSRTRELVGFQDCCNQEIDCVKIDISWFRHDSGIGYFGMTSADSDDELRLAPGNYMQDSTKREMLWSKLS